MATHGQSAPAVLFPLQPLHPDVVVPFARAAVDGGARRLWMGQSLLAETHQTFAYLAGAGIRPAVGTSVTLMPLRHPLEAAVQARSLALITGRPVVAGFGPATPDLVRLLRGEPYAKPAAAAAGYAAAVRAALDGSEEVHESEAAVQGPVGGLIGRIAHPDVEIGLGVLRPGMARAAGTVADAAITWMTPPEYVRGTLVPALAAGARHRDAPPRVVTVVHVGVQRPGRDPYRLALAGAGVHLSTPHYTDMLCRAGVPADPGDPQAGAKELVNAGVYAYGSPADIAAKLAEYHASGVDEVVLNPTGVLLTHGAAAAVEDLSAILAAVKENRP